MVNVDALIVVYFVLLVALFVGFILGIYFIKCKDSVKNKRFYAHKKKERKFINKMKKKYQEEV